MLAFILAFVLIIQAATAFSIQGNWTLVGIKGVAKSNESLVMKVQEYIFKKQQILQKISFFGCKQVVLQAEISEEQLFINDKTYLSQALPNITCNTLNVIDQVYSSFLNTFTFKIFQDSLIFYNPFGEPTIKFKKLVGSRQQRGIVGIWSINQFGDKSTSLSVQIDSTQILLCQGNLIFSYRLQTTKNTINLTTVLSNCSSKEFTSAFQRIKYYRAFKDVIKLYDQSAGVVFQLTYSFAYDPAKPIFGKPIQDKILPSISVSNLAGRWSVSSLFSIPFPSTPYSLIFTSDTINLNGGCSNYSYPYTINSTSQIVTIDNGSSIPKQCSKSDDSLFVSGITKMNKYLLSNPNDKFTLNFYDKTGNIGYSLRNIQAISTQSKPQPKMAAQTASKSSHPLAQGKYLLLLLSRRDLPRVVVKVQKNVVTYKSCNNIRQVFLPAQLTADKSTISFSGGPIISNNTCPINNDQIYYQALNFAKSYTYDASAYSIILSNSQGKEIVTLTQTS